MILLLLSLLTSPASAEDPDWWGDAVADLPVDQAVAEPIIEEKPSGPGVDLDDMRTLLQAGMARVLEGVDPVQALPWTVSPAPPTTAAELRGLLAGSGATQVRLEAVQIHISYFQGQQTVVELSSTLRPSARSQLLRLKVRDQAIGATTLPGGPGVAWEAAHEVLKKALGRAPCDLLPPIADADIERLVPAQFVDDAQTQRDASVLLAQRTCADLSTTPWDRTELRLSQLHFNLLNPEGVVQGGLTMEVTQGPSGAVLSYPRFKKLPPPPVPSE